MTFDDVWRRIRQHAGETFRQKRGSEFRYTLEGDYLCPDRTNYRLPRKDFEAAMRLMPFPSTTVLQHLRGPSYIYAVMMDPRIRGDGSLPAASPMPTPARLPRAIRPSSSSKGPPSGPMPLAGHSFRFVCSLEPERDAAGRPLEFMPQAAYAKAATSKLHRWGAGPFCRFRIPPSWSGKKGVYAITVDAVLRYVGQCEDLGLRFNLGYGQISPKNAYQGGQSTNCKVNHAVLLAAKAGARIQLWFHATDDLDGVEGALITGLRPPWNGRG